jgi:hypothetical protein
MLAHSPTSALGHGPTPGHISRTACSIQSSQWLSVRRTGTASPEAAVRQDGVVAWRLSEKSAYNKRPRQARHQKPKRRSSLKRDVLYAER